MTDSDEFAGTAPEGGWGAGEREEGGGEILRAMERSRSQDEWGAMRERRGDGRDIQPGKVGRLVPGRQASREFEIGCWGGTGVTRVSGRCWSEKNGYR